MAKARHIPGVDGDTPAVEAIQIVLRTRLSEMCALRERALDWTDPEGVHDMRVSSRRLRGALDDFEPYLRKRVLATSLKDIRELANALGDVRDQDVAIMSLQKLNASAPEDVSIVVNDLIKQREIIRKKARSDLRRSLSKTALGKVQKNFEAALDKAVRKRSRKPKSNSDPSYGGVGRLVVGQRLKQLDRLSDSFYHPLKVKPLHRMRIAAKHLRYALELFERCVGANSAAFARKVSGLQSSLGELHDADIWIDAFGAQIQNVKGEKRNGRAGSLWLLNHFVRLHSKHLRNALARWEDWERNDVSGKLGALLTAPSANETLEIASEQDETLVASVPS